MVTAIIEAILALLKTIPIFDKWFSKTATEKVEDAQKDVAAEIDHFEKTGRPE